MLSILILVALDQKSYDMKTLYLVRHAKSSWKKAHLLKDIERPLNKRGKRDAPFMGQVLKKMALQPDILVSSPAVRTQTTAQHIAKALDYPIEQIRLNANIYHANMDEFIQVIQDLNNDWDSAMLFGHNTTYTSFANLYANPPLDNVPTCGVVGIQYAVDSWEDANSTNGTFLFFEYPKKYSQ